MHGPEMVAHPETPYAVLEGNPFHEAGLQVMAQAGADFLSRHCIHTLKAPLDFVVTTNSGALLDCNLYQSAKGLSGVSPAVRERGMIVIASECGEGFGSEEYRQVFEHATSPAAFIEKLLRKEFFIPDQWRTQETYQVMLKNEVWIHTRGIDAETLRRFHFTPVPDIGEAVEQLLWRYGHEARWAVVPDGRMLIPQVA